VPGGSFRGDCLSVFAPCRALEKQAQVLAAEVTGSSNSSASSSGSSSSGQGSNQQSNQQAHVWQAVGLAAATLGLAVLHGGQSGSSLSDSALLVTGLSVPAILAGAAAGGSWVMLVTVMVDDSDGCTRLYQ
jgi:hypothetical protein